MARKLGFLFVIVFFSAVIFFIVSWDDTEVERDGYDWLKSECLRTGRWASGRWQNS